MASVPPSFAEFALEYQAQHIAAARSWDLAALERIAGVLADAKTRGACVFIAGNGGSAAIANHAECDASKGTRVPGVPTLNTRSLTSNMSVLTAIANDLEFSEVFASQLECYARAGDVLLLVSSSGNSPNVVRACRVAKERGLTTVALVGFSGGALKDMAEYVLHVPVDHYGIVEDLHQASIHLVTQFLRSRWTAERAPPDRTE